ncbi:MAG: hypothetical protein K8T91_27750, partial [Planctomycetes bacterium]|nr:hypothetical protein [Planctomycetota bacterium]
MSQPVPSLSGAIPRRFPWRRLLQFRLRSILILTTVIAAVLGWWSNRVRPQRDAVAAITVLNGRVTYDFEKQQLGGPAHWPEWLVSAIGVDCFANVVGVSLNHTRVTNADMRHLRRFPCLEELNLEGTQITESGLEHLRELIALKRIVLPMTATDAGLEKFTGHPGLQEIDLSYGFNITDAGMKHLRGHTGLQCLALQNTQITDAGLQHLQGLSLLRKLNLPGAITDTGLQQVKSLGSLEELNLRFCVLIGDPGLDHLQGLAGLQRLGLGYTKVT